MENRPTDRSAAATGDWWWAFDPRTSLRARAVLVVGGGAILFTVLLSWLAGTIFRRHLTQQTGPAFATLAFQVSDKLDRQIAALHAQVQFAATLEILRSPETMVVDRRRLLDALLAGSPDFAWLGLADARGMVVAGTQGWFEKTSVAAQAWFRVGRENPSAGNLHPSPELARLLGQSSGDSPPLFIDLTAPVLSPQGQLLGVLCAQVRWDPWSHAIQRSVVPEAAVRERIGVTLYNATGDVLLDSGGLGWSQPLEAPAVNSRRGSLAENMGGIGYVTGYARSLGAGEFRGFGWLVTVRQPADLVFAPVRELQRAIRVWGLLLGGILVLASWIAAARLTRRMAVIATAARRIQNGDVLTTMPRPAGNGEMARMCGALGDMVDELRARGENPAAAQPPASETRPW